METAGTNEPLYFNIAEQFDDSLTAVDEDGAVVTTEEIKIPFTDIQLMGTGAVTERTVPIDWRKVDPDRLPISITDVLPLDNPDYVKNQFMTFDEFENAQGDTINLTGYTFPQRVSVADKFSAGTHESI